MSTIAQELADDRKIGMEIAQIGWSEDPAYVAAREAAARHNARIDAPEETKNGYVAVARGARIDDEQQRHPWSVKGQGDTASAALDDLTAKLGERPV